MPYCISMKNAEVHAETLNVITAIKPSDTDNVVGTEVNLLILLSKRSYHNNAYVCRPRAGNIYIKIYH